MGASLLALAKSIYYFIFIVNKARLMHYWFLIKTIIIIIIIIIIISFIFQRIFFLDEIFYHFGKDADQGHRGLARTKDHILYICIKF